jgi:hypothetical protein
MKADEPAGAGKLRWPNGQTYTGGFKSRKLHGDGVLFFPDDKVAES